MELNITVSADGMTFSCSATVRVAEPYTRAFEPLRTTDEPLMVSANYEIMQESAQAIVVTKFRKEAATDIAEALTKQLVELMGSRDTFNGYEAD